jgi:hypothetical protein
MLGDQKGISKAIEVVNIPTGGVSFLLDHSVASNARSGNHLREEINRRSKIDFRADSKQTIGGRGGNRPQQAYNHTRQSNFQGTANQACTRCGMQTHNTCDCRIPKYLQDLYTNNSTRETYGTNLGVNDLFNDFTDQPLNPEANMVLEGVDKLELDHPDTYIIDSDTTHSILKDKRLFHSITPSGRPLTTINGPSQIE